MLTNQSTSVLSSAGTGPVYTDINALAQLRNNARQDPQQALKDVARQFEALFLQMALKSMRQASMGDPIFDSSQSDMYRDMFDKQISLSMSQGKGIGMADALIRQMQKYIPPQPETDKQVEHNIPGVNKIAVTPLNTAFVEKKNSGDGDLAVTAKAKAASKENSRFDTPEQFVNHLLPLAEQAARKLGVKADILLAQAALETGWGKFISRRSDGGSSHNLFNIKADNRWQGNVVNKQTLEFKQGIAVKEKAAFRAYPSYAESFNDYVKFLHDNPRYANALQHSSDAARFVRELQDAGYATDPDYADKIINIMQRDMAEYKIMAAKAGAEAAA